MNLGTLHIKKNIMKKGMIFLLLVMSLYTLSCKDSGIFGERFYGIVIKNKSPKDIYFYNDSRGEFQYPDTTLPSKKLAIKVKANSRYEHTSQTNWEDIIVGMPSDTMSIFVFDANVYEKTDWNEVRANYMVLKRYSISVEYLKSNNYTIIYPE